MAIKLFDFQREAVIKALKNYFLLLCVRVGGGKTLIAMFYARNLINKGIVNKVVFACTVSAAVAVKGEFKEKLNMDIPQLETADSFLAWLRSKSHICIIKHSLFEKLGYDQNVINEIRSICEQPEKKCAIVIDEVHKLSNSKGIAHTAFMNIKFMFERLLIMTATPYSSCLSQIYGIIRLINPTLWKSESAFKRDHIEEKTIMVDGKVARKEIIAYKNLKKLREKISPFTFFYYPKIKLNFIYHNVELKDYTDYYSICKGVLTANELKRIGG